MDPTQPLDDFNICKRPDPEREQIGYIGIIGNTYPVYKGPNKVGRDPQTCSIGLDDQSLSRQHAVINVLDNTKIMLMDLGSLNKTKIGETPLSPYIPYPLKDGDMVSFGNAFGVFRLLEVDDDLPMTQALTDSPTTHRFPTIRKLLVPESPDVSDKDDSFIADTPQCDDSLFRRPSSIIRDSKVTAKSTVTSRTIHSTSMNKSPCLPAPKVYDKVKSNTNPEIHGTISKTCDKTQTEKPKMSEHLKPKGPDPIHMTETQLPMVDIHTSDTQIENADINCEDTQMAYVADLTNTKEFCGILTVSLKALHCDDSELLLPNQIIQSQVTQLPNEDIDLKTSATQDLDIDCSDTQIITEPTNIHTTETQLTYSPDIKPVVEDINSPDLLRNDNHDEVEDVFDDVDGVMPYDFETQCVYENNQDDVKDEDCNFEDMLTQVIIIEPKDAITTQQKSESPFKLPQPSPLKLNQTDRYSRSPRKQLSSVPQTASPEKSMPISAGQYYDNTQEIVDELLTQKTERSELESKANAFVEPCFNVVDSDEQDSQIILAPNMSMDISGTEAAQQIALNVSDLPSSQDIVFTLRPRSDSTDINSSESEMEQQENQSSTVFKRTAKKNIKNKSQDPIVLIETLDLNKTVAKNSIGKKILADNVDEEILTENLERIIATKTKNIDKIPTDLSTRTQKSRTTNKDDKTTVGCEKPKRVLKKNQEDNMNLSEKPDIKGDTKNSAKENPNPHDNIKLGSSCCDVDQPAGIRTRGRQRNKNEIANKVIDKTEPTSKVIKVKINRPTKTNKEQSSKNETKKQSKDKRGNVTRVDKIVSLDASGSVAKDTLCSNEGSSAKRRTTRNRKQNLKYAQNYFTSSDDETLNESLKRVAYSKRKRSPKHTPNDVDLPNKKMKTRSASAAVNASTSNSSTNSNAKVTFDLQVLATDCRSSLEAAAVAGRPMAGPARVLFTTFHQESVDKLLTTLGAKIVQDVSECNLIITPRAKRTVKLLCGVGLGRPIVGEPWIKACVQAHTILDPWDYILEDEEVEKRFGFSMKRTLRGKRNFLKGYNVSCTPNVKPPPEDLKMIVECSGGTWREGGPRWLVVSAQSDEALWPALKARGATIHSSELVLSGVLTQRLDLERTRYA